MLCLLLSHLIDSNGCFASSPSPLLSPDAPGRTDSVSEERDTYTFSKPVLHRSITRIREAQYRYICMLRYGEHPTWITRGKLVISYRNWINVDIIACSMLTRGLCQRPSLTIYQVKVLSRHSQSKQQLLSQRFRTYPPSISLHLQSVRIDVLHQAISVKESTQRHIWRG